jgi:hypothetical protein
MFASKNNRFLQKVFAMICHKNKRALIVKKEFE